MLKSLFFGSIITGIFNAFPLFIIYSHILLVINPVTSEMSKYYEQIKSNYSRDIDHLVTFNNNGLWIKDEINDQINFINAQKFTINHFPMKGFLLQCNTLCGPTMPWPYERIEEYHFSYKSRSRNDGSIDSERFFIQ